MRQQWNSFPHLCRWYDPEAIIQVTQEMGGDWRLMSSPYLLVDGHFRHVDTQSDTLPMYGFDTMDVLAVEQQLMTGRA